MTSAQSGSEDEAESPHVRRFRTHAAYLRALRHLALGDPQLFDQATPSKLIVHGLKDLIIRATPQVASGTVGQDVDRKAVEACLNRAWGTELILATTMELASTSDVVGLANSWGSV